MPTATRFMENWSVGRWGDGGWWVGRSMRKEASGGYPLLLPLIGRKPAAVTGTAITAAAAAAALLR
jgi:hypothetical protein